ncbi:MAG TPA: orotidine-5'-phosphate decarboxylase, partial [Synergistetes bacterium]|nr:orotidine-5'-phosphate decarboxylase [Synergistota bacterium]
ILAADLGDMDAAVETIEPLVRELTYIKIGPGLFAQGGMSFVERVMKLGFKVFLDLKLHDIPNTVSMAVRHFSETGIWALTVHSAGGNAMLEAAAKARDESGNLMKLFGVTVLTSHDSASWESVTPGCVMREALKARVRACGVSGMDGIVCSPADLELVLPIAGRDLEMVVPGIRDQGGHDDQKRSASLERALDRGADYLVIGRPVLNAPSPVLALSEILDRVERWEQTR